MKKLLIVLILAVIAFVILFCYNQRYGTIIEESKYVVFTNAYFHPGGADNNALLIMDKKALNNLKTLYKNKLLEECKCGYDYQIHFFDDNNKHLYTRAINSETDRYFWNNKKIQEAILESVNKIKHSPTHYIFNLKVSVNIESDSIIKLLKQRGFEAFLLSEQNEQYPNIKLTYCEPHSNGRKLDDAEERYKEILRKIKWNSNPIDSSNFYRTTTNRAKQVDYKTNKIARIYYFSNTTNIDSIINQINDMQIDYLFAESCAQYYYIQLLSPQEELDISALQARYPFIEGVSIVEYGFVYEECDLYD